MPGEKDRRGVMEKFVWSVKVKSDHFFVILLEQRIDRCLLISVDITFPVLNAHFGKILSHTVTGGQFPVLTFTLLFTRVEHEATFFASFFGGFEVFFALF